MKNNKLILILALAALLMAGPVFAQADTSQVVKDQEITAKDLGVSNTGILPGNPFYFLKDWSRGIKDTLTFDPVKKAELQLNILNEKAAEIKKLKDLVSPDSLSSSKKLSSTLDDYQKNLNLLKTKIDGIKNVSGSEKSDFLSQLSDSMIRQVQLFSQLKTGVGDTIKNKLSDIQEKITELIAGISLNNETPDEFRSRLEQIIKNQDNGAFKEITIAEVLDRLDEKISKENRLELLRVEENLLLKFQSRLQSEDFSQALSEIMPQLPGDPVRKIKVLDEIREGVSDNNIKNNLNIVRQDLLQKAVDAKEIRRSETEKIISQASKLLADLSDTIASSSMPKSAIISGLIDKAKFNLAQAKQALDLDNYVQAFGQASASISSANYALINIAKFSTSNAGEDLASLKEYHDEIISKINELGLNKDDNSDIFDLLFKSENDIAKISDLSKKKTKADTLIPIIKDAKLLLSRIDNSLSSK